MTRSIVFDSEFFKIMLTGIDHFQVFTLADDFARLSLDDSGFTASSSIKSMKGVMANSTLERPIHGIGQLTTFLQKHKLSAMSTILSEQLRAPIIDIPRSFIDYLSSSIPQLKDKNVLLGVGFRIQHEMDQQELFQFFMNKSTFDRMCVVSDGLGLKYQTPNLPGDHMLKLTGHSDVGLRTLIGSDHIPKLLVEVLTQVDGIYGRFLVLVNLGYSSTVWYGFAHSLNNLPPTSDSLFTVIPSYIPFFDRNHISPVFPHKCFFVETKSVLGNVASAFAQDYPFSKIPLPLSECMHTATGLSIMISIFLAVGIISPNTQIINI